MPKRGEKLPEPFVAALSATSDGDVSEQHRPAGPQAAPRPAGKTPQPPPGSGPKRDEDGTPIGTRSGPKPFVVKPNKARSITIKPELAAQREAAEREALKAKSETKKTRKSDSEPKGKKGAAIPNFELSLLLPENFTLSSSANWHQSGFSPAGRWLIYNPRCKFAGRAFSPRFCPSSAPPCPSPSAQTIAFT